MTDSTPQETPVAPAAPQNQTVTIEQAPAPVSTTWKVLIASWLCFLIPVPMLGMVGWVLGIAVFILSIVVLTRGKTKSGIILLACWLLISPIVWLVGSALMVWVFSLFS